MRETLYIRFLAADAESDVEHAIAAGDAALRSLSAQRAPIDTVLAQAQGRRVVAFVPGGHVRLAAAQVPARQPGKVLLAVPYALEDQVADDIETLHFAIGPRQADGSHPVAIVGRQQIETWMKPFRAHGVRPEALVPETLALPRDADPARWSGLCDGTQVIVRNAPWNGFVCAIDDLPNWLTLADPEKTSTLRLQIAGESPDFSSLDRPVDLLPGYRSALGALAADWKPEQSINLLQGAYSQGRDLQRLWQPWKLAAGLAAAWVLIGGAAFALETWRLDRDVKAQDEANLARYQALFPNETRIVDLSTQLDQQVRALTAGGAGAGVLGLLEVVTQALAATPGLKITNLSYRDQALFLSLTGPNLETLDALRNWFTSGSRGASIEVQTANQEGGAVQIRAKVSPT
ncbi:MAG TPA: type II secretion system protein GspL [Nevskiaceae bacterium]|nr:type II secretion system protein GspL [Nevskiaceae bacterium]